MGNILQLKLNYRNTENDNCAWINCPLDCGAAFHGCKKGDHIELCQNTTTPCIYCGINIKRGILLNHLNKHQGNKE